MRYSKLDGIWTNPKSQIVNNDHFLIWYDFATFQKQNNMDRDPSGCWSGQVGGGANIFLTQ